MVGRNSNLRLQILLTVHTQLMNAKWRWKRNKNLEQQMNKRQAKGHESHANATAINETKTFLPSGEVNLLSKQQPTRPNMPHPTPLCPLWLPILL